MKHLLKILFFIALTACKTQESSPIEGVWRQCLRDGKYKEFIISTHHTAFAESNPHNENESIAFFKSHIQDSQLIITEGMTIEGVSGVLLHDKPDTIRVEIITNDNFIIKNRYNVGIELTRIKNEATAIDLANLSLWKKGYINGFTERAKLANCPDLRTEEEKNEIIELGVLEDDYEEEVMEFPKLPTWAETTFSNYKKDFFIRYDLEPTFLNGDFNGDGLLDIAIFVRKKSNDKDRILFLLKEDHSMYLVGAGNSFGKGGDDFNWLYSWEVFDQPTTYETTFLENGDIDGTQEIQLDHPAISVRADEGSGGLIYYNGKEFIWIHQGD